MEHLGAFESRGRTGVLGKRSLSRWLYIIERFCFSAFERRACVLWRIDSFLAFGKFHAQDLSTDA